jgi:hypothetical protein
MGLHKNSVNTYTFNFIKAILSKNNLYLLHTTKNELSYFNGRYCLQYVLYTKLKRN